MNKKKIPVVETQLYVCIRDVDNDILRRINLCILLSDNV